MEALINNLTNILNNFGIFGGFFIIYIESIIPIIPLCVFITLNVLTFGNIVGFFISWIATIFGCLTMHLLCKKLDNKLEKKYSSNKKIMNLKEKISNISFSSLVLLIAIPFTPAFAINIASGLSKISTKKYLYALIIGKIPMIYFWGFIGKTLLESITDISTIIEICVMIILALLVSKIANKYLRI